MYIKIIVDIGMHDINKSYFLINKKLKKYTLINLLSQ